MSIKYSFFTALWNMQMLWKTHDMFYIRLMIASVKDWRREKCPL